mmetsp:Transcript_4484/g.8293  ORF Transcript_4484/g.8293 Transcript_4484/m.8293 type:complete len:327 (+) Transcript_4484:1066-2046(+)
MLAKKSANTSEMMAISFIKMFNAGPDVSFKGSPTVSPTTAALCRSVPLPWTWVSPLAKVMDTHPFSTYFLALSHAPPVLAWEMASWTPDTREPTNSPETASTPNRNPVRMGLSMTSSPGRIISLREASVEILMQRAWSGSPWPGVPCSSPGMVSNWCLTSFTMAIAAVPTDFMHRAVNQYGSMAPMKRKANVTGRSTLMTTSTLSSPVLAWLEIREMKPPNRASDTKAADPMANPLPMAAVVFPAASRASVLSRTSSGNSDISAMPPALSHTGPYTSIVKQVERVPNIPKAAKATPYMPTNWKDSHTVMEINVMGRIADFIPRASP